MKRMMTMALLVAALMGASMSASAKGRKCEVVRFGKGDVRNEIVIRKGNCPRCAEFKRKKAFSAFDRHDPRFMDPRFRDPRFRDHHFKGGKHGHKKHRW